MTDQVEENIDFYQEMLKSKTNFERKDIEIINSFTNLLSPEFTETFSVKNIHFLSLAHYMKYCKAKVFNDENVAEQLMKIKDKKETAYSFNGTPIGERTYSR